MTPRPPGRVPARLWTQQEIADYLGVDRRTVRNRVADGSFVAYRLPGSRAIRLDLEQVKATLEIVPTVRAK